MNFAASFPVQLNDETVAWFDRRDEAVAYATQLAIVHLDDHIEVRSQERRLRPDTKETRRLIIAEFFPRNDVAT